MKYAVAIIEYTDGPFYVFNPDQEDFEIARTVIIGRDGNYTGGTPTEKDFEEVYKIMDEYNEMWKDETLEERTLTPFQKDGLYSNI